MIFFQFHFFQHAFLNNYHQFLHQMFLVIEDIYMQVSVSQNFDLGF